MKTELNYTKGMEVVNNVNELRGKCRIYSGATFNDGDVIDIPEDPQIQQFNRGNNKFRIEIAIIVNQKPKWVNLAAFTTLPVIGEGEGFRDDFLKKHEINAKIAQGDACDQVLALISLKRLKVSKEKAKAAVLIQENGVWSRKKDEEGNDLFKDSNFSVFEVME